MEATVNKHYPDSFYHGKRVRVNETFDDKGTTYVEVELVENGDTFCALPNEIDR